MSVNVGQQARKLEKRKNATLEERQVMALEEIADNLPKLHGELTSMTRFMQHIAKNAK